MMYNAKDFPEPSKFSPYRFLTSSESSKGYTLRTDIQDPESITFGFGRRYAVISESINNYLHDI